MGEVILADFCNDNKELIDILVQSGIVSNQLIVQKEVFNKFLELKEKYPSVLDRYELVAEDFKISTATARKYIYKMKRRIRIQEVKISRLKKDG